MKPGPTGTWQATGGAERARRLWDAGVATSEIGRQCGCTKSAIVGYAHRNGFPPRPSPIGRVREEVREAVPRVPDRPHHKPVEGATPKRRHQRVRLIPKPPQPVYVPPAPTPRFSGCQFIAGDGRPWTCCGAAAVAGKPYCSEHLARVFVRRPHAGAAEHGVRW
jgi:GcrA cell cycle regulator